MRTKIQLKSDANIEARQPTNQNDMVAIKHYYKVSKNEHATIEDKNKQIHSQIKIHNEHLKNLLKLTNTKNKLNSTSTIGHKI